MAKRMGMYSQTPRLKIGKFSLCRQDPDGDDKKIWVEDEGPEGGEAGEFPEEMVEQVIEKFFNENY